MTFFLEFEKVLGIASSDDKECILLGDFNCDVCNNSSASHTDSLQFYTSLNGFTQLIDSPTRVTNHSSTLIDLIFVTDPELYSDCGVFCTSISDHFFIYAVRDFNVSAKNSQTYIEYRSFCKLDEQTFVNDLMNVSWDIVSDLDDIDLAWETWVYLFMNIVDSHIPLCKKRIRNNACPWITDDIVKIMKERDRIHKVAVRRNDMSLWDEYIRLRNKVNK